MATKTQWRSLADLLRLDSVGGRWLWVTISGTVFAALLVAFSSFWLVNTETMQRLRRHYASLGAILSEHLRYAVQVQDRIIAERILETVLSRDPDLVASAVVDASGAVWVGVVDETRPNLWPELGETLAAHEAWREVKTENGHYFVAIVEVPGEEVAAEPTADGDGLLDILVEPNGEGTEATAATSAEAHRRWLALVVDHDRILAGRRRAVRILSGLTLIVVLLVGAGGFAISRPTVRSLQELTQMAQAVSRRRFDHDVPASLVAERNEIGTLAKAFQQALQIIRSSFRELRSLAEEVAGGADRIHNVSREVLQGSQVQAQAADETSSSMEEIAAQIITVAENTSQFANRVEEISASIEEMGTSIEEVSRITEQQASHAEEISETIVRSLKAIEEIARQIDEIAAKGEETLTTALRGKEAVGDSIRQLRELSESMESSAAAIERLTERTEDIGKISALIQDIADQTNILAINAAIEAARAGDAGRGFAVVADEVRRLAERSLEATREITEMIREVQGEIRQVFERAVQGSAASRIGIASADKATEAIDEIVAHTQRTRDLLRDANTRMQGQMEANSGILDAVAMMQRMAEQVKLAMQEQTETSQQIVRAVEAMKQDTIQVANATQEQKRGGELVVVAIENISAIANENLQAMEQLTAIAEQLSAAAERLFNNIARYEGTA